MVAGTALTRSVGVGHCPGRHLPAPEIIAREIVEDLTAALAEFEAVAAALEKNGVPEVEAAH